MSFVYNFDSGVHATSDGFATERVIELELTHQAVADWPCDSDQIPEDYLVASRIAGDSSIAIYQWYDRDNRVGIVDLSRGSAYCRGYGKTPAEARMVINDLRILYPEVDRDKTPDIVPVTFWSYGQHGPSSVRRKLDAPSWEEIEANYPPGAREKLADLFDGSFIPGYGGQLLLWSGDPGTGKTTALRMLAREWRSWCDLHYIADPDKFFGAHADYMMSVMLDENDEPIELSSRPVSSPDQRWRVLVLEDSGELLQKNARQEVGQALQRFLNVVDGMIGRGLRVMVLVTTNEDVGTLHPAVARPGRCASEIKFPSFTFREGVEWLEDHGVLEDVPTAERGKRYSLADLYAKVEGFTGATDDVRKTVGFGM